MKFVNLIDYDLKQVDDVDLLVVNIKQSKSECYVDKDLYVRMSPATVKLDGEELVRYVKERFN
jgi:hypothetical protein